MLRAGYCVLGTACCVRGAYRPLFCQPPAGDPAAWLRLIVEQEVGPLLADYWREQPAVAKAQLRKLLA